MNASVFVVGVDVRVLRHPVTRDRESCCQASLLYLGVLLLVFGNFALFLQRVAAANGAQGLDAVEVLLLGGCARGWQMLTVVSLAKAVCGLAYPSKRHSLGQDAAWA